MKIAKYVIPKEKINIRFFPLVIHFLYVHNISVLFGQNRFYKFYIRYIITDGQILYFTETNVPGRHKSLMNFCVCVCVS